MVRLVSNEQELASKTEMVYVAGAKLLQLCDAENAPPLKLNVYGAVPPLTPVMLSAPLF